MLTVTVPTWTWALPVVVAYAGGIGWAAWSVIDLGLRRAEARVGRWLARRSPRTSA